MSRYSVIERLTTTLAAVCPIAAVSVDSSTSGSYTAAAGATSGEISAANAALAAFDWTQAAHDAWSVVQQGNTPRQWPTDYTVGDARENIIERRVRELRRDLEQLRASTQSYINTLCTATSTSFNVADFTFKGVAATAVNPVNVRSDAGWAPRRRR